MLRLLVLAPVLLNRCCWLLLLLLQGWPHWAHGPCWHCADPPAS
jgi:hypothetical protein